MAAVIVSRERERERRMGQSCCKYKAKDIRYLEAALLLAAGIIRSCSKTLA